MKNLIIFHMESVSDIIFKMNKDCFPNINRLQRYFEYYPNYYSTATSTVMVLTDLFFGDMSLFEESCYLEDIYTVKSSQKSLFEYLNDNGYCTHAFYYSGFKEERNKKINNVINKTGTMWYGDEEKDFLLCLDNYVSSEKAFALFIEENVSHVTYSGHRINREDKPAINYYIERYQALDKTIGQVFECIKRNELWNKTIILLYGDHGDEYWFHGFHEGYTHAIEPFTSLTHCPLFIFDGKNEGTINNQLVATTDIYNIVLSRLGIRNIKSDRKYVISRNLFVNQKRKEEIFVKGYSITDGNYTLLITKKGMSMYENLMDPYNQNNVLDFFDLLRNNKLKYNRQFDKMISSHYKKVMIKAERDEIEKQYYRLREILLQYIKKNSLLEQGFCVNKLYRGCRYNRFSWMLKRWKVWIKYICLPMLGKIKKLV